MAAFVGEVSVFAETNLGTRIAMNVPQDITAGAFKREFEIVHMTCLPNSGEIQVNGLMVRRKSCLYYMPDSLPIKYAFCGIGSTWFLHVAASHVHNLCVSRLPHAAAAATLPKSQDFINCNAEEEKENTVHISGKKKKKKKRKKYNEKYMQNTASAILEGCSCRFEEKPSDTNKSQFVAPENEVQNLVKLNPHSKQGSPSEMSTEVISVTGIINKYFPTLDGVDNFGSPSLSDGTSRAVHKEIKDQPKTPETLPNGSRAPLHVSLVSETSRDKRSESKLRKRLLVASQSLGISTVKCSPTVSLCRFKDGNLMQHSSRTKGSLFEISDSDD